MWRIAEAIATRWRPPRNVRQQLAMKALLWVSWEACKTAGEEENKNELSDMVVKLKEDYLNDMQY